MKPSWKAAVVLAALVATILDAILVQRMYSTFTGGFLQPFYLDGAAQVGGFLFGAFWFNAALAALFAPLVIEGVVRIPRLRFAQQLVLAAALAWVPHFVLVTDRFSIPGYVGDAAEFRFGTVAGLGGAALGLALIVGALVLGLAAVLLAVRLVPDSRLAFAQRRGRARVAWLVLVLGAPILLALGTVDVQRQWNRISSGRLADDVARICTDFDGDGYGLSIWPRDPAPFDGSVHPYAVEVPGNGVDEDGIGGDLAAKDEGRFEPTDPVPFMHHPDVIVFVLESYRWDLLEATADGKPVTPVLRGLVADGAVTGPFYSHNSYTAPSIYHLFTGSLSITAKDTLIDDFRANGYYTACVSGEDETFEEIERYAGLRRAHFFRDARDHRDERTSLSAGPGSLTVPWKVVVRDVDELLTQQREDERPLFLYVNLQDCHYPYVHRALDPLVAGEPLARGDIGPDTREQLLRTYFNAAANVDLAIGRILDAFKQARARPPAVLVVGDHGESLYEDGMLGHGMHITRMQLRTLFVLQGLPAECVFPMGHVDLRGLLRRALARPAGPPTARIDPDRWVFQYIGGLPKPQQLGAAFADGAVGYDLRTRASFSWGEPPAGADQALQDALTLWSQLMLRRSKLGE